MKIPLVDLRAQYASIRDELREAIERVCEAQAFVLGPEVQRFEREVAERIGVRHAVGVSSGTDALVVALLALGVAAGDEVVTTAYSFIATAEAIARVGARPVFVDVEPETLNLDIERLERVINAKTRAILVVHLFGTPARMDVIEEIAARHGVPIVEDAAQAFGASWGGRAVGSWGKIGCYSFFPTKPLGAFGDGGMVVTSDADLAGRCRLLRSHGAANKARPHELVGGNFRLDALQAAVLSAKIAHLEGWLERRRRHAAAYDEAFNGLSRVELLSRPVAAQSSCAVYAVRVLDGRRDGLAVWLAERGVETAIYYRRPLHLEPCFAGFGYGCGDFPEAERAATEVLALPIYPELAEEQREEIIAAVRDYFRR